MTPPKHQSMFSVWRCCVNFNQVSRSTISRREIVACARPLQEHRFLPTDEKACCGCEQTEQSVLQPTNTGHFDYSGAPHRLLGPSLEAKRAVWCVFFYLLLGNNSINQLTLTLKCPSNFPPGLLLLVHTVIIEVCKVMSLHVSRKWRQALFCTVWIFNSRFLESCNTPMMLRMHQQHTKRPLPKEIYWRRKPLEKKTTCFPSDQTLLPTECCCFLIQ